jgi:hypothetical protein
MKRYGAANVHADNDDAVLCNDDALLLIDENDKVVCQKHLADHIAFDKKENTTHRPWTFIAVFLLSVLMCAPGARAADPDDLASIRSFPPDTTPYTRPEVPEDGWHLGREGALSGAIPPTIRDVLIVNAVVNNTNPNLLLTDTFNDGETSIAVNPLNPDEIVITAFSGTSGGNAALWHSLDGGLIWTKRFAIPPAPGVPGFFACGVRVTRPSTTAWATNCQEQFWGLAPTDSLALTSTVARRPVRQTPKPGTGSRRVA